MNSSHPNLFGSQIDILAKEYVIGKHKILLPVDHMLDQYQSNWKRYDTALGYISQTIFKKYSKFTAIDIGANIGDSAALINKYIEIPILCIEGHPEFVPFLEYNASQIGNIQIAKYFIGKDGESICLENIISCGGTASIINAISSESFPNNQISLKSLASILEIFPQFKHSKLLKIDTDGCDFNIINDSIETIDLIKPILCFEYDINFSTNAEIDALETIENLLNIGYTSFLVYDNFGNYLINLNGYEYKKFIDLNAYLISNHRKSGNSAVYYFDIYAFPKIDEDLFLEIKDIEINS